MIYISVLKNLAIQIGIVTVKSVYNFTILFCLNVYSKWFYMQSFLLSVGVIPMKILNTCSTQRYLAHTVSLARKGHLTSKLNSKTVPVLSSLIFPFNYYHLRCTLPDFPSVSSLASLPFLSCRHRTTTCMSYEATKRG